MNSFRRFLARQEIRVGFSTISGLLLFLASIPTAIVAGIESTEVAGLPPEWIAGIGVASLWLTKIGRYAQAFADRLRGLRDLVGPDVPFGDAPAVGSPPVEEEIILTGLPEGEEV